MKPLQIAGLALALVGAAAAPAMPQRASQEDLKERRAKKLASPFLTKAAWTTDYDEAQKMAQEHGKLIFAYFTRSYAP